MKFQKIMKSLLISMVLVLVTTAASADPCPITTNVDDLSDREAFRYTIVNHFNTLNTSNCAVTDPLSHADALYFDRSIIFNTPELNYAAGSTFNEIIFSGSPLNFHLVPGTDVIIGNVSEAATLANPALNSANYTVAHGAGYDDGYVFFDLRTNYASSAQPLTIEDAMAPANYNQDNFPFQCKDDASGEVHFRNVVIQTHWPITQEVMFERNDFAKTKCFKNAGLAFVCAGVIDKTKAPGATDWCAEDMSSEDTSDGGIELPPEIGGEIADNDGDGFTGFNDCNDFDASINPGAAEVCDGIDNDCDGLVDAADSDVTDALTFYKDFDSDGYGNGTAQFCEAPTRGFAEVGGDCNNFDASINPGAREICDGIDNDCDKLIDMADTDVVASTWYADTDGDSYGDPFNTTTDCTAPAGYTSDNQDCDDTDSTINPAGTEICGDGVDNNCDGIFSEDCDGDGYTPTDGDCDDADSAINPGAAEICDDTLDNDCDTFIDLDDSDCTDDFDGDGFTPSGGDCDDFDASVNPDATEICDDGIDNDCDGFIDAADSDCSDPSDDNDGDGFSPDDGDCDDFNANIYPGAIDLCDFHDNDCDGDIDEDQDCDADIDGDGSTVGDGDCDDFDATVFPGAAEICDFKDNNCDGLIDEGCNPDIDFDGDGFTPNGGDCNDTNASINPQAPEICLDGIDNNCDGNIDEDGCIGADGQVTASNGGELAGTTAIGCQLNTAASATNMIHLWMMWLSLAPLMFIGFFRRMK